MTKPKTIIFMLLAGVFSLWILSFFCHLNFEICHFFAKHQIEGIQLAKLPRQPKHLLVISQPPSLWNQ
jgi:hypothetical protein